MCSVVADCLQKQHNKETKSYKVGTWMLMKEFLETNQTQRRVWNEQIKKNQTG